VSYADDVPPLYLDEQVFGFSVPQNDLIAQVDDIWRINERKDYLTVNWPLDFVSAQVERPPGEISSTHRRYKIDQSRPAEFAIASTGSARTPN
jgi:hypothetical protein